MGEIVDLMSAQGMVAGQIYGYVPDPPWGPPHRCPGCQPCPDEPALAALWNKWQGLEAKLRALGESPSCAIVRGEKFPATYTNAERIARGCIPASIAIDSHSDTPIEQPNQSAAVKQNDTVDTSQVESKPPVVTAHKAPAKRTSKTTKAPKEQGSLF